MHPSHAPISHAALRYCPKAIDAAAFPSRTVRPGSPFSVRRRTVCGASTCFIVNRWEPTWPQFADFFHQIILAGGGLAVVFNLLGAGLTNIDVGCAGVGLSRGVQKNLSTLIFSFPSFMPVGRRPGLCRLRPLSLTRKSAPDGTGHSTPNPAMPGHPLSLTRRGWSRGAHRADY
jgi:hypothetical protein